MASLPEPGWRSIFRTKNWLHNWCAPLSQPIVIIYEGWLVDHVYCNVGILNGAWRSGSGVGWVCFDFPGPLPIWKRLKSRSSPETAWAGIPCLDGAAVIRRPDAVTWSLLEGGCQPLLLPQNWTEDSWAPGLPLSAAQGRGEKPIMVVLTAGHIQRSRSWSWIFEMVRKWRHRSELISHNYPVLIGLHQSPSIVPFTPLVSVRMRPITILTTTVQFQWLTDVILTYGFANKTWLRNFAKNDYSLTIEHMDKEDMLITFNTDYCGDKPDNFSSASP